MNKEDLIKKINEYYNSDCKGYRSKVIANTEVYRAYNFSYLSFMISEGFYYKKWISKNYDNPDSLGGKLHNQVKFYLEEFHISNLSTLYPPLHPQNCDIIIALREV